MSSWISSLLSLFTIGYFEIWKVGLLLSMSAFLPLFRLTHHDGRVSREMSVQISNKVFAATSSETQARDYSQENADQSEDDPKGRLISDDSPSSESAEYDNKTCLEMAHDSTFHSSSTTNDEELG